MTQAERDRSGWEDEVDPTGPPVAVMAGDLRRPLWQAVPATAAGVAESGRRAGFRSRFRKEWEFESPRPHMDRGYVIVGAPIVDATAGLVPPRTLRPPATYPSYAAVRWPSST